MALEDNNDIRNVMATDLCQYMASGLSTKLGTEVTMEAVSEVFLGYKPFLATKPKEAQVAKKAVPSKAAAKPAAEAAKPASTPAPKAAATKPAEAKPAPAAKTEKAKCERIKKGGEKCTSNATKTLTVNGEEKNFCTPCHKIEEKNQAKSTEVAATPAATTKAPVKKPVEKPKVQDKSKKTDSLALKQITDKDGDTLWMERASGHNIVIDQDTKKALGVFDLKDQVMYTLTDEAKTYCEANNITFDPEDEAAADDDTVVIDEDGVVADEDGEVFEVDPEEDE